MCFVIKLSFTALILAIITEANEKTDRASIPPSYINTLLAQLQSPPMDPILFWNLVALQACANDYDTSIAPVPDQVGPATTARAFAIIHGAMYNSMRSFADSYEHLAGRSGASNPNVALKTSGMTAAIIEAAYQTLSSLYPKQRPIFDAVYRFHLNQTRNSSDAHTEIIMGLTVGRLTASFIVDGRASDGSNAFDYYIPTMSPGFHQADPTQSYQGYISSHWSKVKPFFLDSASQFRPSNTVGDTPLARARYLNSSTYARDLEEVKSFGSKASVVRTDEQTRIGIAWAYDGAPKLGTPPRLYNQVVRIIAMQQRNTLEQNARLFALVNYAMADAAIAAWDTKYYYNFWRPILGIRRAPNPFHTDDAWLPIGAPADGAGADFTPAFPAYVSGHATLGTSVFQALCLFYGTDSIAFSFQSDEYNGKTRDSNTGLIRTPSSRYYPSLTAAEQENANSRVYLGVHWRSDVQQGRVLGTQVAAEVFRKFQ